jgi:DNA-binding NarL/FixJ family response regulator
MIRMAPISIAIVDDFKIVVAGVARMLEPYADRIVVSELDTGEGVRTEVDVALVDTFAQPEAHRLDISPLLDDPNIGRVVIYSWSTSATLANRAIEQGASGYLSKGLEPIEVVEAIEAIHAGRTMIVNTAAHAEPPARDWPGRNAGLSEREAEVLALLIDGSSNREIAEDLYLSVNTVKTHLKAIYRKLGVSNRTAAANRSAEHGVEWPGDSDRWMARYR